MATTDLKLDEPGSLPRPGPIGRLVRLGFGLLCLGYVYELIQLREILINDAGRIQTAVWNGVLVGLFLISYVINIGFSRAWKKWPAFISAGLILLMAGVGYLTAGTSETIFLARGLWFWEIYLFSHLGFAFIVAVIIGTPGCEMRAFHDLYSRVTGIPTMEHYCPVGPLHPLDQWEAGLGRKQV